MAVIRVSAGMEGDSDKDLVLTQAQAVEIRDSLVKNFGFDDRQLKTMGVGKSASGNDLPGAGQVQILVYPMGTKAAAEKREPTAPDTEALPAQKVPAAGEVKPLQR